MRSSTPRRCTRTGTVADYAAEQHQARAFTIELDPAHNNPVAFQLPETLPGGEYTLVVSEGQDRFPPEKRKIIVNQYQAPRLYKDVDFTRKSYGPADLVPIIDWRLMA